MKTYIALGSDSLFHMYLVFEFQFPGLETFRGEILHTHEYQGAEHFKGKKVVVVGFGDCAIDAALEISHFNPKVYVLTSFTISFYAL